MKEISVLSLICSCLYPETRKNILGDFEGTPLPELPDQSFCFFSVLSHEKCENEKRRLSPADLDIKPINKRASGQAFEVILKPSSPVTDAAHCVTTPPKRDLSLEDIQKKLEAAEDRRRVRSLPITLRAPQKLSVTAACDQQLDRNQTGPKFILRLTSPSIIQSITALIDFLTPEAQ